MLKDLQDATTSPWEALAGISCFSTDNAAGVIAHRGVRGPPTFPIQTLNKHTTQAITMTDMGVKYDLSIAEKGVEEGRLEVLKDLKDPGRQGTEEAKQAHAFATTAEVDPPVEIMGDHHHHNRVMRGEK